jgi:type IV pilus assembly protein PilF
LAAATVIALGGALSGCVSSPHDGAGVLRSDLTSPSEESDARRRARTRLMLATEYFQNSQNSVALDELSKALQIDPTFPDAYDLAGLIYMGMNEKAQAEANFRRALSLSPHNANIMHNLGWMLCQQTRFDEADATFQRALAEPGYNGQAKTLMARGICQARAGDKAKAEATLMQSYQLDAGNPVTGYNLAQLLYQRGDYSRAQFYIRRLNNSELANAESLWLGMKVERKLDNRVAMDQLASQLKRRFPGSPQLDSYERRAFDE